MSPDEELRDALVQAAFTVTARIAPVAAAHDLSLTQLRVLAILRDHRPKISELATHLGLERSTVSGLVDRATKRGLVRREPSPDDARAAHVSLTDEGARLADALSAEITALLAPMTASLTAPERRRLAALLQSSLATGEVGLAPRGSQGP